MDANALLRRMVDIPSTSRAEGALAAFLVEHMRTLGFQAEVDAAGNAVGILGAGAETVVLLGHMDTVAGQPPVRIADGKLYGRGSVDAKGALAAFIVAAAAAGPRPDRRLVVVGATEEETATSKGAHYVADSFTPTACVIGEPSGVDAVTLGYKGRIVLAYEGRGAAAHSAGLREGTLEEGVAFWHRLQAWAEAASAGKPMFERLDPALREIQSRHDGLTESIALTASIRIPPGLTPAEVQRMVERLRGDRGTLRFWGADPPFRAPKNTPLVRAFLRAIRESGREPSFKLKSGTSDMNVVGPRWGCPILAYGPGDSRLDHTPDEHLDLEEYNRAITVLTRVLTLL